jgi:hypothetical protein
VKHISMDTLDSPATAAWQPTIGPVGFYVGASREDYIKTRPEVFNIVRYNRSQ